MISSVAAIMTDGDFDAIFADIREFEWDEKKRERNWRIHRVDFNDARRSGQLCVDPPVGPSQRSPISDIRVCR
jgi:hypothetical protein